MRIRFGSHLDGERGWQPANQLNVTTVGPLGLLNLLETQLGLLRAEQTSARRVVHYLTCLKQCDAPSRFYHRSLASDELGTAARLLAWRDLWHLHGWSGSLATAHSPRLGDMQAVEAIAVRVKGLAGSVGERLQGVAAVLEKRKPAIAEVLLCEFLTAHPQRWQAVLRLLPLREDASASASSAASPACLLGDLQRALAAISCGGTPEKLSWQDDGSLRFVRAETATLAARCLAESLRQQGAGQTLIVAEQGRSTLDEVLANAQLNRQGFKEPSAFRPALQVLPLMLEQVWSPLNVVGLLQFLTHPVCPLPALARTRIAKKLARSPGIGLGKDWQEMLAQIEAACSVYGRNWPAVRDSIAFWIEQPRFARNSAPGAPIEALLARVTALADYFRARLAADKVEQRFAFNAAYSQVWACKEALETLLEQGTLDIRPRQLQKLVAQVTARGSSNPLLVAELGACLSVANPAAAIDACDHVVWWQLAAGAMPSPYPWSRQEQAELNAAGVVLPSLTDELNRLAVDWLKPILSARKSLTLVLPPPGQEVHPVWQMIETAFGEPPPVHSLEQYLESGGVAMQPIVHRPLPARERCWQLPAGTPIQPRGPDSFSSLESYLFNPYQWLLKYPAALRPSEILDVSDSFLLYGNLAHGLIEHFYRRPDALTMPDSDFAAWFDENFAGIVQAEGAVLLMPGRGADLDNFRGQLRRAMGQLRSHLAQAGVTKVEPEKALAGHFKGGKIMGVADLVLTRADDSIAIVDLKWAGGAKYPKKLATNSHLQLAIYAELLRQETGQWPHLAYFILSQARLIAPDDRYFPDAAVIPKNKGLKNQGTPQLWARFQSTWQWRKEMQDAGQFELILSEADLKDESTPWPDDGLAPEVLNPRYNDFLALAGWEVTQ
ncbi:MAG: Inactivated superfamily I helicase [Candidatus Accumulibacter appositus]|uniref:Inactivated superfamily I helicase n=1 Tax=Candidatus Accumulibacter appositus TaxID=1454003 RepID=A0A011NGD0_9PROT|nr:PD-(D/E)XK nuclease family protein [Accumulibacter sp.]EXI81773.1 MAG: Inactivated superfamily I helicase [Candidatus Accumulibacter appositus]HRF04148.1 PD-(D/E)XK nuclease family protein [Accumulibacter sp.]